MVHLTIEMPEEALSSLREPPERFAAELRFAAAVQWYHQGRISGSKAAQIAGMTRLEFLDELARRKLDVIKVAVEEPRVRPTRGRDERVTGSSKANPASAAGASDVSLGRKPQERDAPQQPSPNGAAG